MKRIAETVKGPVITGLARSAPADILRAAEAVKAAERKRIHTFISTSPLHMKYKLRMEPEAVLAAVTASVTLARQYTDDVEWSAEDGTRTEADFLCRCVEAAIKAGATTDQHPRYCRLRRAGRHGADFRDGPHPRAGRRQGDSLHPLP